jgi:type IV secretory pathway VirB10-like protein
MRPSTPRRAAVAALGGALLVLMVGMFAFGLGVGPAGAVEPLPPTTPTPETPAPTPETPAPTPETPAPTPETPAPTPETPAPTTTTQAPRTTTTQRNTTTTQRSTTTSSTSSTSTTSSSTTTIAAAAGPSSSDTSGGTGSPFWSSGRKIAAVVTLLLLAAVGMSALTYFYWRATRPSGAGTDGKGSAGDDTGTGSVPEVTGPVGPVSPMLAEALRPDPFVTRDDLGLL